MLLKYGVKVDVTTSSGNHLMFAAVKYGSPEMVFLFLEQEIDAK